MLTQSRVLELFEYRNDGNLVWKIKLRNIQIGDTAGHVTPRGVVLVGIDDRSYLLHRVIWLYFNATLPDFVDHVNRDKRDNRIENLRSATRHENNSNVGVRKDNLSGYKGVYFRKETNKWIASIQKDKKRMLLGKFDSAEDAAQAYNEAAIELHKEFACLNVI